MKQGLSRGFTAAEKTELWDRWQRGEPLKVIGRAFGKGSSSIYFQLAPHGGIRPAPRRRSRLSLTFLEREEISAAVSEATYKIALPYIDNTLIAHVGSSFGAWRLVYETKVRAVSREEAVERAREKFFDVSNTDVQTYDKKKRKGPDNMFIFSDQVVVEKIQ